MFYWIKLFQISSKYNFAKLPATVKPYTTISGYKYVWYINGNAINNFNKNEFNASTNGTYKVQVTTGTGKEAFSDEKK